MTRTRSRVGRCCDSKGAEEQSRNNRLKLHVVGSSVRLNVTEISSSRCVLL